MLSTVQFVVEVRGSWPPLVEDDPFADLTKILVCWGSASVIYHYYRRTCFLSNKMLRGPNWGRALPRPCSWWEKACCHLPKNPTPCSGRRVLALGWNEPRCFFDIWNTDDASGVECWLLLTADLYSAFRSEDTEAHYCWCDVNWTLSCLVFILLVSHWR